MLQEALEAAHRDSDPRISLETVLAHLIEEDGVAETLAACIPQARIAALRDELHETVDLFAASRVIAARRCHW